jgi:hypothetical protein
LKDKNELFIEFFSKEVFTLAKFRGEVAKVVALVIDTLISQGAKISTRLHKFANPKCQ